MGAGTILLALAGNCVQVFYMFPKLHNLRAVVRAAEYNGSLASVGPQADMFQRLHEYSVVLNIVSILAALGMAFFLFMATKSMEKTV